MSLKKVKYYLSMFAKTRLLSQEMIEQYQQRCLQLLDDPAVLESVVDRVAYYNRLSAEFSIHRNVIDEDGFHKTCSMPIADLKHDQMGSFYRYDLLSIARFFDSRLLLSFAVGDVTFEPTVPAIVKSRPIMNSCSESRSVLLKLNQLRHFNFIVDAMPFDEKANRLVWRGGAYQPHRLQFLRDFFSHPLCDVAQVKDASAYAYGTYMTIQEQLKYKFILCIEGNDVATNLKWAMSSNSVCMMVKPQYETWFMEGRLRAGVHYVELADDYSDLEEKIHYYSMHTDEAQEMTRQANRYVLQFNNPMLEDLIGMMVLYQFFHYSRQLVSPYQEFFLTS